VFLRIIFKKNFFLFKGTASELFRQAMIKVDEKLKGKNLFFVFNKKVFGN